MAEQAAEGKKAGGSFYKPVPKYLGSALFAAVVAFLTWLTVGFTELRTALTTGIRALVTIPAVCVLFRGAGASVAPALAKTGSNAQSRAPITRKSTTPTTCASGIRLECLANASKSALANLLALPVLPH